MDINGKRVLLTGATGGIGMAIARELKIQGAQLILSGRNTTNLSQFAKELGGTADDVSFIAADLSCDEDLERLLSEVGKVDILIANAGLPGIDDITACSKQEIDNCLTVNLRAPILLARGLMPQMVERGHGHLLFVSSISGKMPSSLSSLYSSSKYGLRGFADCIRMDLHGTGVGVSTIYPGPIRDAGMIADSGVILPFGTPSSTSNEVALAVVRAIKKI
ncbi:SDR family NAD(P)-dependent oxidoreductase [Acinetobacter beijerinckii]|uniref:SDR family NAD(P)-dependent oxidoreductase n=1 Tax=Acinetobacter beijerinckii TaxID=262668 RepID=UPI00360C7689